MFPLFQAYPQLEKTIAHIEICNLPTPIQLLDRFGKAVNHTGLYIKRDDLSGDLFGGNKVRTLEFLLAAAHRDGGNIAIGLAGTSMALASNIYARHLDIPLKTILLRQTHTQEAQKNLRYFQYLNADIFQAESFAHVDELIGRIVQEAAEAHHHGPHIMQPSKPLGMCGYINAAFELKQQIDNGDVPEPDYVYIPMGLLGTSTGIMLGLKAVGLKTQVVCVPVMPLTEQKALETKQNMIALFSEAATFLKDRANDFPELSITVDDIEMRHTLPEQMDAHIHKILHWQQQFDDLEGISLDTSWTGHAIVRLVEDLESGQLDNKTVLYWHTYNSRRYPDAVAEIDYKQLPQTFWHYFEDDELVLINQPDL